MKQKTRFKNFGNIGYRSMNGWYIGINPQKTSVDPYLPRIAYINAQSSNSGQNNIIVPEVATNPLCCRIANLQKHINIYYCSFNNISVKRKKLCYRKSLTQHYILTWW